MFYNADDTRGSERLQYRLKFAPLPRPPSPAAPTHTWG